MKKTLIIFAHPRFEESRINRALIETAQAADDVTIRDLYELYPDFNIDIQAEQIELLQHDTIIWHHPFYWYSCPPLLKHWIDLVLEYNWAYGPNGSLLSGKTALNVLTAGGSREVYCADGSNRYTISQFLRPFEQTAVLCGTEYLPPFAVLGTARLTRQGILDHQTEYANLLELLHQGELGLKAKDACQFLNDLPEIKNTKVK